jgi:hypothetical protein
MKNLLHTQGNHAAGENPAEEVEDWQIVDTVRRMHGPKAAQSMELRLNSARKNGVGFEEQPKKKSKQVTISRRTLLGAASVVGAATLLGVHGAGSAIDAAGKAGNEALEKQIVWERKAYAIIGELYDLSMDSISILLGSKVGKALSEDISGELSLSKIGETLQKIAKSAIKGGNIDWTSLPSAFVELMRTYKELRKKVEEIVRKGNELKKHLSSFDAKTKLDITKRKDDIIEDFTKGFNDRFQENFSMGIISPDKDDEKEDEDDE